MLSSGGSFHMIHCTMVVEQQQQLKPREQHSYHKDQNFLFASVCMGLLMRETICFVHINDSSNEHILINKRLKDGKDRFFLPVPDVQFKCHLIVIPNMYLCNNLFISPPQN